MSTFILIVSDILLPGFKAVAMVTLTPFKSLIGQKKTEPGRSWLIHQSVLHNKPDHAGIPIMHCRTVDLRATLTEVQTFT